MTNIGQIGEELTKKYLINNGYHILEKNYKVPFGEIDIIAEKDHCICFVEVKCRKSNKYGLPEEAVTANKKKKIIKVAQLYLKKNAIIDKRTRFDVVSVQFDLNQLKEVRHIVNAFSE